MIKVAVTGGSGLLGWHARARLHAANCAARFAKADIPYDIVNLDRAAFANPDLLVSQLEGVFCILHFAGVNRGSQEEVAAANPAIARQLVSACERAGVKPHIVYANSIHCDTESVYGLSKRRAGEILAASSDHYTDVVLPHIFGECARPNYNNVTATFIDAAVNGRTPDINSDGAVQLLHVGVAVGRMIEEMSGKGTRRIDLAGREISVQALWDTICRLKSTYDEGILPALNDAFDVALFNTYRTVLYPAQFPRTLKLNSDHRGQLFEAVKCAGSGGQTFLSWTEPGKTRGEHFHLNKIERFLVLEGEATIRIRRVLHDDIWTYKVSGSSPAIVDMPTVHTHSIENTGSRPLLTLFWSNEIFDPGAPDTYADPVLGG